MASQPAPPFSSFLWDRVQRQLLSDPSAVAALEASDDGEGLAYRLTRWELLHRVRSYVATVFAIWSSRGQRVR